MMYSALKLNKQGDDIQPWHTPSPILNQSVVLWPVLTVASCSAYRFLRRQVRWSGIPISLRIFHSLLWSTQSKTSVVNDGEVFFFFSNSLAFPMIQQMLGIWFLVPLPLWIPAYPSGSSCFMYCWSLAWRTFSIALLACEMSATVWYILWQIHTTIFRIDNQQWPTVEHRELCLIFCNMLYWKNIWKRIYICIINV